MARTLITMPASAARGAVVEIRTLIAHPMETGFRAAEDGRVPPRDIVHRFRCHYNGELVVDAELFSAVSANPYFAFSIVATDSGSLSFAWEGDNGFAQTETRPFTVA